jgi:hypothetical protein
MSYRRGVSDEHERLVADALRAQATSAAITQAEPSGPGAPVPRLAARWVLSLSLLVGLAAGTVAAVVTLR